jgi:PilZ domain
MRTYKHDERRHHARARLFRTAELFAEARIGSCIVRNVSATGAGLTMESTTHVPDTFDLSFDSGRTLRPCRVLWRTAREIGLEFKGKSFYPGTEIERSHAPQ